MNGNTMEHINEIVQGMNKIHGCCLTSTCQISSYEWSQVVNYHSIPLLTSDFTRCERCDRCNLVKHENGIDIVRSHFQPQLACILKECKGFKSLESKYEIDQNHTYRNLKI